MKATREFTAGPDDSGRRLDRILKALLPGLPLSAIYGALRRGRVRVNGRKAKPDARLAEGDLIALEEALLGPAERPPEPREGRGPAAARLKLSPWIAFEGRDLLFIDKPRGLASHGEGGLDLIVREALRERSAASLAFSPGPLHRLDRNTSGIITFSKTMAGAQAFTELLRAGKIRKRYLALLEGRLEAEEDWEDWLLRDEERRVTRVLASGGAAGGESEGGRALATARPLLSAGNSTLALVELKTGLTHQIRAQASSRGQPLEGDLKYGGQRAEGGYLLHAWLLDFAEPPFDDIPRRIVASLPPEAWKRLAARFGEAELSEALERERA